MSAGSTACTCALQLCAPCSHLFVLFIHIIPEMQGIGDTESIVILVPYFKILSHLSKAIEKNLLG